MKNLSRPSRRFKNSPFLCALCAFAVKKMFHEAPATMTPISDTSGALRVVGLMCLAEVLSMTGFAAYPAFLALLRDTWGISNSEAGFIGGAFFGGYMIAVPILSSLTDRFDARRVYMLSCALSGVSAVGFAFFAGGVVSAALRGARRRFRHGALIELLREVSVTLFQKEGSDLARALPGAAPS